MEDTTGQKSCLHLPFCYFAVNSDHLCFLAVSIYRKLHEHISIYLQKQTSKQSSAYSFVEPQTTSSRARRRSAASYPSSPRARGALNAQSRSSMTAVRNSNRGRSRGFLGSLLVRIHEMLESEDRLTSTMALALLGMPLVIMIHQEMRSNGGRSPIPTITAAMNSA